MSTSSFRAGIVVEVDGTQYELLRQLETGLWQTEELRTKRIKEFTEIELHSLYASKQLIFRAPQEPGQKFSSVKIAASYSPEQWETAKIRRSYVLAVLDIPNTRERLGPVIHGIWEKLRKPEIAPNPATVIRWKNRFQTAGRDITVLIEQSRNKGNRTPRYPAEVGTFMQQALDAKYLCLERGTIQEALDYATNLVLQENKLRPEALQLPVPSRRNLKSMIEAIPAFDRYAARHGRTAAAKRFRAVLAHRTTMAPLERAEIDHTPLDLMVIDDDSGLPLGRPYLTVCLDDYTRCVLGLYISFEPPSHFTVSRCLKMAFLPKIELLKQYPAIQNTWDAHGVMRDLVVDNGQEFHSISLENLCYSLGIELHYSARKTPWFKGKIERFQGTLNRAVAHGVPGTTFSNIFDKEDYDPLKQALLRYSTLKEIVYTWVADVYHQKVHRSLGHPPAVVWGNSIRAEDILVPDNPAQLDYLLGQSETRTLTHKGIELNGLLYNSPDLTALRRKHGSTLLVDIRVDKANLGHIMVLSPDQRETFKVPALQFDYANGLSDWQHRVCKRFAARQMSAYNSEAWLEAKVRIRKLVNAEFMLKKQKTRTKAARFMNMDAGSAGQPAPQQGGVEASPTPPPSPESVPTEVIPVESRPAADLAADKGPNRERRLKPIYRERSPAALAEERTESEVLKHD